MDDPDHPYGTALRGKTVALVGFDDRHRRIARRFREAGCEVVAGQRTPRVAAADGIRTESIERASACADIVMLVDSDSHRPPFYLRTVHEHLRAGAYLGFTDARNYRAGTLVPPRSVNVFSFADTPHGSTVVVHQDPAGDTHDIARAVGSVTGDGDATFAALDVAARAFVAACCDALVAEGYSPDAASAACANELRRASSAPQPAREGGRAVRIAVDDLRTTVRALIFETRAGGTLADDELRFRVC